MRKPLFRSFSDLSIRYKLFAAFLLLVTIPFVALLFVHLTLTARDSERQAVFTAHTVLDETNSFLQYKTQAIKENLNFIAFNDEVEKIITSDPKLYADVNHWGEAANKVSQILNQPPYNADISVIRLYMRQGFAAAMESEYYKSLDKLTNEPWYPAFANRNDVFIWLPASSFPDSADPESVDLLRKIPNPHNIQHFDGIVRATISRQAINAVLDHADFMPHATAMLLNKQGDLLSVSNNYTFTRSETRLLSDQLNKLANADSYWNDHLMVGGKRMLFGVQSVSNSDLALAIVVPYSDIFQSVNKARNQFIVIFLFIVPLIFPLSFWAAESLTKRLRLLSRHLRRVRHGDFDIAPLPINSDEVGELTQDFNLMVRNIARLMEANYEMGREIKNKELKALQAQINPHFLYNTLDLINIMAIERGAGDITEVVSELAVFYKLSLSNGDEIVDLQIELKHVASYVRIQNMRFGGSIRLIVDVEPELYGCKVPKIILQPIIENSILHGILEKDDQQGTIRISAVRDGDDVIIAVEDDGIGMDMDRQSVVRAGPQRNPKGGFGMRNIQDRLELYYGPQYGLRVSSEPGAGTSVTFRIRSVRQEDQAAEIEETGYRALTS